MALALLKDVKELELKELITPAQLQTLQGILHDVYLTRLPKPVEYQHRTGLVDVFNKIARDIYVSGNSTDIPAVEVFGSFVMDIFSSDSDLDLSINFSNNTADCPRDKKKRVLRKFAKKMFELQARGHVSRVQLILTARVPIVKVTDRGTGIECDISVENRDGIERSMILRMVSSVDERFKKLGFLMKAWAKEHNINSSKDQTLNSLSILSIVAFHLQTRDPPILPPFYMILRGGTDSASVQKEIKCFADYGKKNKESLADLFVSLLTKFESVKELWPQGLCASIFEGAWIYKTWDSGIGCISVEDFTERTENVARAVKPAQVKIIYQCIYRSLCDIMAFRDGRIQGGKLIERLFGKVSYPSEDGKYDRKPEQTAAHFPITPEPIQSKKIRLTNPWENESHTHTESIAKTDKSWPPFDAQRSATRGGGNRMSCGPQHVSSVVLPNPLEFSGPPGHNVQPPRPRWNSNSRNPTEFVQYLTPNYVQHSQPSLFPNLGWPQLNYNQGPGTGHAHPPQRRR